MEENENVNENKPKKSNGLAIASLVLGIMSIVFTFIVQWIGLVMGIIGIVLAVNARKENPSEMATTGLVLSIIGTALSALTFFACVALTTALGGISTFI